MFTWICPTCGREVPPAYNECPDCAAREKAKAQGGAEETGAGTPPTPPMAAHAAAPPAGAHYAPAPGRNAIPTWLMAILFTFAFLGLGAGVYFLAHYFNGGSRTAATTPAETIPTKGPAKEHAMQKYIEVSGIRFVETAKKQTEARFLVVNHSGADIADLGGTVNIWGRTNRSEEEAAGTFSFKLPSLGPNESKEATAPLKTKLKVYELPDWQNISAEVQITSP